MFPNSIQYEKVYLEQCFFFFFLVFLIVVNATWWIFSCELINASTSIQSCWASTDGLTDRFFSLWCEVPRPLSCTGIEHIRQNSTAWFQVMLAPKFWDINYWSKSGLAAYICNSSIQCAEAGRLSVQEEEEDKAKEVKGMFSYGLVCGAWVSG